MSSNGDLMEVGALWEREGKSGKFLAGEIKIALPPGTPVLLFKNDNRSNDKAPILRVMVRSTDLSVGAQPQSSSFQPSVPTTGEDDVPW